MPRLLALFAILAVAAACGPAQSTRPEPKDPDPVLPRPDGVTHFNRVPKGVPVAKPAPKRRIAYTLPRLPAAPKTTRVCHMPTPPRTGVLPRKRKWKQYDFSGDTLHPVAYGARVAERRPSSLVRTATDVREALLRHSGKFTACYRWVRFRGRVQWRGEPSLPVEFSVDPLGAIVNPKVSYGSSGWGRNTNKDERDFVACVRDVLKRVRVSRRTSRTTQVEARLDFGMSRALRGRPRLRPKRPRFGRVDELAAQACVATWPKMPVTKLRVDTLVRFDDYDDAQAEREHKRYERRYNRYSGTKRFRVAPSVRIGRHCGRHDDRLDKAAIRNGIRSNLGAFRECYRDALARAPGLRGRVFTQFAISETGELGGVQVKVPNGDAKFKSCIAKHIMAIRTPRVPNQPIGVRYPFQLEPERPIVHTAAQALAAGDGKRAAILYAEQVRASGGGTAECKARLGVLRAMLRVAPWIDDHRVRSVATSLATYARSVGPTSSGMRTCLRGVARTLNRVALWPLMPGKRIPIFSSVRRDLLGAMEVAGQISNLLALWPTHPDAVVLRHLEITIRASFGDAERVQKLLVDKQFPQKLSRKMVWRGMGALDTARREAARFKTGMRRVCRSGLY